MSKKNEVRNLTDPINTRVMKPSAFVNATKFEYKFSTHGVSLCEHKNKIIRA